MVAVVLIAMLTAGTVLAASRQGTGSQSGAAGDTTVGAATGQPSGQASARKSTSGTANPGTPASEVADAPTSGGLVGAPPATGSATQPSNASCLRVTHQVNTQWQGGLEAQYTVINCGTTAINGWVVAVTFSDTVEVHVWSAQPDNGSPTVRFSSLPFDSAIPAGKSIVFGFNATWSSGANRTITGCAVAAGSCS